jgi:hypothetical protein
VFCFFFSLLFGFFRVGGSYKSVMGMLVEKLAEINSGARSEASRVGHYSKNVTS